MVVENIVMSIELSATDERHQDDVTWRDAI
jgi:hypothetical protein